MFNTVESPGPPRKGSASKEGSDGGLAETEDVSLDLLYDRPLAVSFLDMEISLKQIDQRMKRDRPPKRHRPPLEPGRLIPILRRNSRSSRDFPIPGSPTTKTTCPWAACLLKQSERSRSSRSRPTKGVSPRSASTSRRVLGTRAETTSQARIGSAFPFRGFSPRGRV